MINILGSTWSYFLVSSCWLCFLYLINLVASELSEPFLLFGLSLYISYIVLTYYKSYYKSILFVCIIYKIQLEFLPLLVIVRLILIYHCFFHNNKISPIATYIKSITNYQTLNEVLNWNKHPDNLTLVLDDKKHHIYIVGIPFVEIYYCKSFSHQQFGNLDFTIEHHKFSSKKFLELELGLDFVIMFWEGLSSLIVKKESSLNNTIYSFALSTFKYYGLSNEVIWKKCLNLNDEDLINKLKIKLGNLDDFSFLENDVKQFGVYDIECLSSELWDKFDSVGSLNRFYEFVFQKNS